jgi:hypothetical protein
VIETADADELLAIGRALIGRGINQKARPRAFAGERTDADFRVKRFDELGDFQRFAHIACSRRHDDFVLRQKAIFIVRDFEQQPLVIAARDVAGDDQRSGGSDVFAGEGIVIHIEKLGTERGHAGQKRENDADRESSDHWPPLQAVGPNRHLTITSSHKLRDAVNAMTVMQSITLTPPDYVDLRFLAREGERPCYTAIVYSSSGVSRSGHCPAADPVPTAVV